MNPLLAITIDFGILVCKWYGSIGASGTSEGCYILFYSQRLPYRSLAAKTGHSEPNATGLSGLRFPPSFQLGNRLFGIECTCDNACAYNFLVWFIIPDVEGSVHGQEMRDEEDKRRDER
jgi:hypothetical protein